MRRVMAKVASLPESALLPSRRLTRTSGGMELVSIIPQLLRRLSDLLDRVDDLVQGAVDLRQRTLERFFQGEEIAPEFALQAGAHVVIAEGFDHLLDVVQRPDDRVERVVDTLDDLRKSP